MKKYGIINFLLFCTLILCSQNAWAIRLMGKVTGQGNAPAQSALLDIGSKTCQTDQNGMFSIWLDPGKYHLQVRGYQITHIQEGNRSIDHQALISFRPRRDRYFEITVK